MKKFNVGDRVKVSQLDADGNQLYGTVTDPNFLGIAVLVECDSAVDKRYCYTEDKEVMYLRYMLEKI